ncbi:fimbrial protein [Salmonella enterica subsp. enterica]|nr:fimbrial protein [Salmonella enterica]EBG5097057.1 fimbrial protein [Salmonella enterica subsp. enterica serovar India]ECI4108480.1 fimbrial protein [Salmonella enterica subsp. enterica]EGM1790978.1 fimbrial protein [Salmonella enterica subsp. enterica]EGR9488956.1 fimbrial protein [Salmonella enterica subsp. enterica]
MTKYGLFLAAVLLFPVAGGVQAGGTKSVELKLHLVVTQPPPCEINDMSTNIGLENIYDDQVPPLPVHPFTIRVYCEKDVADTYSYLKLQLQGATITIDGEQVLQTSIENLGIRLTYNNVLAPIGTGEWLYLDTSQSSDGILYNFNLTAQPVKKYAHDWINPDSYTASASLILEYE